MPSGQAQHRKLTSSRVPACSCVIIVFHILPPTWKCHQARAHHLYFQHQAYFEDCKMQTVLKPRGAPCLLQPSFLSVSCNAPRLPSSVIFPSSNSPLENLLALSCRPWILRRDAQFWLSIGLDSEMPGALVRQLLVFSRTASQKGLDVEGDWGCGWYHSTDTEVGSQTS